MTTIIPSEPISGSELFAAIKDNRADQVARLLASDNAWRAWSGASAPLEAAINAGAAESAVACVRSGAAVSAAPSVAWAGSYLDWALDRGVEEIYAREGQKKTRYGSGANELPKRWEALCAALLAAGIDPNTADHEGVTPLMSACVRGQANAALLLLDHGALLELKDKYGHTALACAAERGALSCARLLISRGADVATRSLRGGILRRALLFSPLKQNALCIGELMRAGADFKTRESDGKSALDVIAQRARAGDEEGRLAAGLLRIAERMELEAHCAIPRGLSARKIAL